MSIKNANIGFYQNDIIYFITMVLMVLGATSFLAHFYIIKTRGRSLIHDSQFQVMICLIAVTSMLIYFASNILPMDVLFTVVSAITTTGASIESSTVMGAWPSFVIFIIMMLMLIGGHTDAVACRADNYTIVVLAFFYCRCTRMSKIRIVATLGGITAKILYLRAIIRQKTKS